MNSILQKSNNVLLAHTHVHTNGAFVFKEHTHKRLWSDRNINLIIVDPLIVLYCTQSRITFHSAASHLAQSPKHTTYFKSYYL